MVRLARRWVILLLAVLTLAAAPPGKDEFEQGRTRFEAGDAQGALPWLEAAYERSGRRPSTIRALAQCHRALGHTQDALRYFREYLATQPSDAEAVAETIRLLEAEEATPRLTPTAPPPAAPVDNFLPAPRPPPVVPAPEVPTPEAPAPAVTEASGPPWLWITLGAVVVAGAVTAAAVLATREATPYGGTLDTVVER